ncbi:hypothetical protein L7F22_024794 [Adiantum nelumboides]|nr:hypothetical protein [Adiantum nelumboides]
MNGKLSCFKYKCIISEGFLASFHEVQIAHAKNLPTGQFANIMREVNRLCLLDVKTVLLLLEILGELEEKNLILMQESQDVETSLENLNAKCNDTKVNNKSEIASLQSQLQAIKAAIKIEEEPQSNLQTKTNVNMIDKTYDVSFDEIASKVYEVYVRCGLEDDPALGTLQKLTSMEKQRRLTLREEKMEKQHMEQEKRAERSLEQAHAPIPRKTGKPVMFRSRLSKKKKMQFTEVKTDDDKELIEFLERDY